MIRVVTKTIIGDDSSKPNSACTAMSTRDANSGNSTRFSEWHTYR